MRHLYRGPVSRLEFLCPAAHLIGEGPVPGTLKEFGGRVMTTVHLNQTKRPDRLGRPLSGALLVASLAIVACSGLTMAAPAMWHAVTPLHETQSPSLSACAAIPASADRLACYDQLGKEARSAPAKGALAPLNAR
jgi:hypothetical protein